MILNYHHSHKLNHKIIIIFAYKIITIPASKKPNKQTKHKLNQIKSNFYLYGNKFEAIKIVCLREKIWGFLNESGHGLTNIIHD